GAGASGAVVAIELHVGVGAVRGREEYLAGEVDEGTGHGRVRRRAHARRVETAVDVRDADRIADRPARRPHLGAGVAVVRREVEHAVDHRERGGAAALVPGPDVHDLRRTGGRAVAAPQLAARGAVARAEAHGASELGEASGARAAWVDGDVLE